MKYLQNKFTIIGIVTLIISSFSASAYADADDYHNSRSEHHRYHYANQYRHDEYDNGYYDGYSNGRYYAQHYRRRYRSRRQYRYRRHNDSSMSNIYINAPIPILPLPGLQLRIQR